MSENQELTGSIITAAIEVHRHFGPGLLEHAYHACLKYELDELGLNVLHEPFLPITYKRLVVERAFRPDLIVDGRVIVEVKHIEKIVSVHEAQLRTYMQLTGIRTGLLLNFNTTVLKNGIRRLELPV